MGAGVFAMQVMAIVGRDHRQANVVRDLAQGIVVGTVELVRPATRYRSGRETSARKPRPPRAPCRSSARRVLAAPVRPTSIRKARSAPSVSASLLVDARLEIEPLAVGGTQQLRAGSGSRRDFGPAGSDGSCRRPPRRQPGGEVAVGAFARRQVGLAADNGLIPRSTAFL